VKCHSRPLCAFLSEAGATSGEAAVGARTTAINPRPNVPPFFVAAEMIAASRPFEQNQDGQLRNSSKQASKTSASLTSATVL
jgi:hypothetical protein